MNWYHKTSIYQIYPRSFYDSTGDGIGDIQGIIQKLDYVKSIGFETIWISPFYASPQIDFGYDISDYYTIAPEYGTLQDTEQLISEIHRRDMKVVFDMVMNHTSDQHPWFLESRSSRTNAKADWYIWLDKPNNWKSIVGPKGWQYAKERDQWYFASFLPFQPDLNYRNPKVKKTMFDICRYWLGKGVDGFRLDIFNCIIKDKDFRNNPFSLLHTIPSEEYPGGYFQDRKYSLNLEENFALAQELRKVVDEFPDPPRMLLGEVTGKNETVRKYLGENQDGLHLVFSFDILFFKFSASFFRKKILEYEHHFPFPNVPTAVFSNHDQLRSMRRIGNNLEKGKLLAMLQFTMRAVPTVYSGEEIGMTNENLPIATAKDSLAQTFKWVPQFIANVLPVGINRDGARTPMQWNTERNAGFSGAAQTWLPVNKDIENRNVAQQMQDENSLLHVFKNLNALRKKYAALSEGLIGILHEGKSSLLIFTRTSGEDKFLVILNFSKTSTSYNLSDPAKEIIYSLGKTMVSDYRCTLPAYGGIILKI